MCVSVFPNQIGFSGIQINAVNAEILSTQRADDFLNPDAGIVQFQTFLEDVMYILDVQKDKLFFSGRTAVRHDLHQIPTEILAGAPAVTAGHDLLSGSQRVFYMFRTGKRDEVVHIIRMNAAMVDELSQPA